MCLSFFGGVFACNGSTGSSSRVGRFCLVTGTFFSYFLERMSEFDRESIIHPRVDIVNTLHGVRVASDGISDIFSKIKLLLFL